MIYIVSYRIKDPQGNERVCRDKYDEAVPIEVIKNSLKSRGATNISVNKQRERRAT